MIEIPKHILLTACAEADIPERDIDWEYDDGYRTSMFGFIAEEGLMALAKFCTILGSYTEVEGETDIDLHMAMQVAENARQTTRGRRMGFCFPGVKVTEV